MTEGPRTPVVVDTNVFGASLVASRHSLAFRYRPILAGREIFLSFVTAAELRFGASLAGWGDRRLRRLDRELDLPEIVLPHEDVQKQYVELRVWCVRSGHGLGQKEHEADRWVAATALWLDVPLVAHDGIFLDVDGLEVLTELDR